MVNTRDANEVGVGAVAVLATMATAEQAVEVGARPGVGVGGVGVGVVATPAVGITTVPEVQAPVTAAALAVAARVEPSQIS